MKLTCTRSFVLAAVAALALASASTAGAVIQVQKGITGIRLGMSQAQVKAGLGNPGRTKTGHNDFGPFTQFLYRGGITVTFQGNTSVSAVAITGHTDRTPSGVGVGSTEKQIKNGVRGARCQTRAAVRDCHVGAFRAGRRVTDFILGPSGRVTRVTIGFVID
jgi:opacity protein-like surface antigen